MKESIKQNNGKEKIIGERRDEQNKKDCISEEENMIMESKKKNK